MTIDKLALALALVACGAPEAGFDAGALDAQVDAVDAALVPDESTASDAGALVEDAGAPSADWRITEVLVDYLETFSDPFEPGFRLRVRCEYVGRLPEPATPVWIDGRLDLDGVEGRYVDMGASIRCGDEAVSIERFQLYPEVLCREPPEPPGPPRIVGLTVWLSWPEGSYRDPESSRMVLAEATATFDSSAYCASRAD